MIIQIDKKYANLHLVASKDDTRYILKSVYFNTTDKCAVATDGRKMLQVPIKLNEGDPGIKDPKPFVMAAEDFKRCVADCKRARMLHITLWIAPDMRITWEGGYADPMDGTYPNYKQVIPEAKLKPTLTVAFNPEYLMQLKKGLTIKKDVTAIYMQQDDPNGPLLIGTPDSPEARAVLMPMRAGNTSRTDKDAPKLFGQTFRSMEELEGEAVREHIRKNWDQIEAKAIRKLRKDGWTVEPPKKPENDAQGESDGKMGVVEAMLGVEKGIAE